MLCFCSRTFLMLLPKIFYYSGPHKLPTNGVPSNWTRCQSSQWISRPSVHRIYTYREIDKLVLIFLYPRFHFVSGISATSRRSVEVWWVRFEIDPHEPQSTTACCGSNRRLVRSTAPPRRNPTPIQIWEIPFIFPLTKMWFLNIPTVHKFWDRAGVGHGIKARRSQDSLVTTFDEILFSPNPVFRWWWSLSSANRSLHAGFNFYL